MNKKGIAPIIIVLIIALLAAGGITGYTYIKNKNKPIACTADAKLCPDGSSVGRIPPSCEFEECPTTTTIPIATTTKETTATTSSSLKPSEYCLDWDLFSDNAYKDGQVHEEIKRIQEKLGVEPVGGHYGPQTQAAIEAFNKKYDIHQEIDCCAPTKDYTRIYQGTISKFNELYCDKPQYQIAITRKNNPDICSNGLLLALVQSKILNYPDLWLRMPKNNQSIIMKVPYSSGVRIAIGVNAVGSGNNQFLDTYMSKIYNDNSLVAYYDNNKFEYTSQIDAYCQTVDTQNFQLHHNPISGLQELRIKNIKSNYNILIDTEGCYSGS